MKKSNLMCVGFMADSRPVWYDGYTPKVGDYIMTIGTDGILRISGRVRTQPDVGFPSVVWHDGAPDNYTSLFAMADGVDEPIDRYMWVGTVGHRGSVIWASSASAASGDEIFDSSLKSVGVAVADEDGTLRLAWYPDAMVSAGKHVYVRKDHLKSTHANTPDTVPEGQKFYIVEILDELARAELKFPTWPTDPLHALAVLGEEYGELNQAMLELMYEPGKGRATLERVRTEAIQTAAMALRLLKNMDGYDFTKK